jgi:tetratricopeptide (TPR) repeat protein
VFALALGLRLLYLLAWRDTLLFSTPVGDARVYLDWARAIAGGDWLGHEVFYQAPLYPYFLAGVLRATGSETWGPRLVQAVLGSLACVLLGRAGERFFGRAVGLAAGIGLALYAPAIYFDGLIQKPALDGLLLAALLLVLSGAATPVGVGRALAAGALLGLLALSRENALVLVPVVALWLAVLPGDTSTRRRVTAAGALAAGALLVLVPIGVRNQALGGRFLVTTAQLGPNLWIGNHPGATGRYEPLRPNRGNARYEREDARELAVEALGRELTPAEVSDYWRDRALAYMRAQPLDALRLLAHKAFLVANARELPDTEGIEAYTHESLLLRALFAVFHFGALVPLAAAGIVAHRREWRRLWLFPALALALAASVALFYVFARYRYTLVPVVMPLAAAGAIAIYGALRRGRRGGADAAKLAVAAILAALLSDWPLPDTGSVGLTHYSVGAALLDAGDLAQAEAELELAVSELPNFAPAHARLGVVLRMRGEFARALASYERALQIDPSFVGAHTGRGITLEGLGRSDDAAQSYRRALQLDPNDPFANTNLGNQRFHAGDVRSALLLYERAYAAAPDDPDFGANLAAALLETGNPTRAVELFDRVLARAPRHAAARFNRAAALDALGRRDEARAELETLVAQEPAGSPYAQAARQTLARLGGR